MPWPGTWAVRWPICSATSPSAAGSSLPATSPKKRACPRSQDILAELAKPGRDPREPFEAFHFAEGVEKIEDVRPGMKLPGVVTNLTAFGAFVDIGVHQDGLVHVSELADRFVKNPAEVVKVHQQVMVPVLEVDLARKRISLSLKSGASSPKIGPRKMEKKETGATAGKGSKPQNNFFNNPFAAAFGKK